MLILAARFKKLFLHGRVRFRRSHSGPGFTYYLAPSCLEQLYDLLNGPSDVYSQGGGEAVEFHPPFPPAAASIFGATARLSNRTVALTSSPLS